MEITNVPPASSASRPGAAGSAEGPAERARRFVEDVLIPLEEEAEALGGKLPEETIAAVKRAT